MKPIMIYTDGACERNPGPGGYEVVRLDGNSRTEFSGGFRRTTNNRMEIMAAIVGLESLKHRSTVTVYSDSRYLVDGMAKGWAKRWQRANWMRNETEKAANDDLWARLLDVCADHAVTFKWVRGHAADSENLRCDYLAVEARRMAGLACDRGYETPNRVQKSFTWKTSTGR